MNPRRRRRRSYRRRGRRNVAMVPVANPRRRRRRSYRRNQAAAMPRAYYGLNRRRRRGYRRNPDGFGAMNWQNLLPLVGAGVGAGLTIGYVTPMVTATMGIAPAGIMFRAAQAAVTLLGSWVLTSMRVASRRTAAAFAATGLSIVGLGLIQDWQSGALTMAPAAPAAAGMRGVRGMGAYRQAFGNAAYTSMPAIPQMSGYSIVR